LVGTAAESRSLATSGETETRRALDKTEVYSFVLIVGSMVAFDALLFPGYYWLFLILGLVDGFSTRYRNGTLIAVERIFFAFFVLLASAVSLSFGVAEICTETALVIALIDFSFFLRRVENPASGEMSKVIRARIVSYGYSLLPAAVFSVGAVSLLSSAFQFRPVFGAIANPGYAVAEVALTSVGVFALLVLVARLVATRAR
jgi:hypothetical protein